MHRPSKPHCGDDGKIALELGQSDCLNIVEDQVVHLIWIPITLIPKLPQFYTIYQSALVIHSTRMEIDQRREENLDERC